MPQEEVGMRKAIESTHVSLGGEIGSPQDWAFHDIGLPNAFVERMNSSPKFVAPTTLRETTWNSSVIEGDVASFVADLKQQPGRDNVKYGIGVLDAVLMGRGLIDEFPLLVTPVAVGRGQHLFEAIDGAPALKLADVTRCSHDVLRPICIPS